MPKFENCLARLALPNIAGWGLLFCFSVKKFLYHIGFIQVARGFSTAVEACVGGTNYRSMFCVTFVIKLNMNFEI